MKLVYDGTDEVVMVGDNVTLHSHHPDEDGEMWTVKYITKPHKPASTGRVGLERGQFVTEYFPSVIGAHWIEREDQHEDFI